MEAQHKEILEQLNQSLEKLNFYARLISYGMILMVIIVVFIAFFSKNGVY